MKAFQCFSHYEFAWTFSHFISFPVVLHSLHLLRITLQCSLQAEAAKPVLKLYSSRTAINGSEEWKAQVSTLVWFIYPFRNYLCVCLLQQTFDGKGSSMDNVPSLSEAYMEVAPILSNRSWVESLTLVDKVCALSPNFQCWLPIAPSDGLNAECQFSLCWTLCDMWWNKNTSFFLIKNGQGLDRWVGGHGASLVSWTSPQSWKLAGYHTQILHNFTSRNSAEHLVTLIFNKTASNNWYQGCVFVSDLRKVTLKRHSFLPIIWQFLFFSLSCLNVHEIKVTVTVQILLHSAVK